MNAGGLRPRVLADSQVPSAVLQGGEDRRVTEPARCGGKSEVVRTLKDSLVSSACGWADVGPGR